METASRTASVAFTLAMTVGIMGSAALKGQDSATASATVVPPIIQFNGVMNAPVARNESRDADSKGFVTATFSLYELQEGGSPLWSESQKVELDEQGRYMVLLGANSHAGLPIELFTSGRALWLGVHPESSEAAELPRVLLVVVPYALKASDADTLGGRPASAYALTASLAETELPGRTAIANPMAGSASAVLPLVTTSGQTMFTGATTAPSALVEVQQKGTGDALLLESPRATSASTYLIHAKAGATPIDVFKVDTRGDVTAALGTFLGTTTA